jgi:serine/threonine-protein kinase
MGAVYRVEHRRMTRTVALKVINPALLRNSGTVGRFQQEVRAAAQLSHENIGRAYGPEFRAGGITRPVLHPFRKAGFHL